jgi:hypothetical protein
MKEARISISPIDHTNEFGHPVRVSASRSGVEDFDVILELVTERDKIKILCSSDWALNLAETLKRRVDESKTEEKSKQF